MGEGGGGTDALNNSNKGCESYHLVSYVNKKTTRNFWNLGKKRTSSRGRGEGWHFWG